MQVHRGVRPAPRPQPVPGERRGAGRPVRAGAQRPPPVHRPLARAVDRQHQAGREQRQTGQVERGARVGPVGEAGPAQAGQGGQGDGADRQVHQEDGGPTPHRDQQATGARAQRRAEEQGDPGRYREPAGPGAGLAEEQVHRERYQRRRGDTLHRSEGDQFGGGTGAGTGERGGGEGGQAGAVPADGAEALGQVGGGGQAGRQGEQVAGDGPLHGAQRGVQFPADVGYGDVYHATVDHRQQRPGEQHVERQRGEAAGRVGHGCGHRARRRVRGRRAGAGFGAGPGSGCGAGSGAGSGLAAVRLTASRRW
jgi:translation initiation factor IF-2